MPKAKITTTSRDSATVEPFELRSGNATRLVFKPELVNNREDEAKAVRGHLLWQRRSRTEKGDDWVDESHTKLTQMKAGSGIKLELRTDELYLLTQIVRGLYGKFWDNGNKLPKNGEEFELADYAQAAIKLDSLGNVAELLKITGEEDFLALLSLLSKGENSKDVIEAISKLNIGDLSELNSLAGIGLLKQALNRWQQNQGNPDEKFWQAELTSYSFVLSQAFSSPVILVQKEAYLGGKSIHNKGGKVTDFLLKNALTDHVLVVEIKTPETALLEKSEYRQGVFAPSKELGGVVTQAAKQRQELCQNFNALRTATEDATEESIRLAEPKCLVIAGNTSELDSAAKKDSFELFRRELRHIEVVTFDELFKKIEVLLALLEGKEGQG
ncbi:Shedu immune nuclease family protein [Rosistilla oblonga]|uniref:Shedu immune nuclease family protein n=1 Tax=Rosistilla oblonga TaxID=2527990 RepID=UPI003A977EF9